MSISVIIPAYNEAGEIAQTLEEVQNRCSNEVDEIIVVDGGSSDTTLSKAESAGAVTFVSPEKGRASQMNYGARQASGSILYFLHADSIPPLHFDQKLKKALKTGSDAGCFQLAFDDNHWLLQSYAWFTRFDVDMFRFGDQSLFIKKEIFHRLNGYRDNHILMEDNEIIRRIKRNHSFSLLDDKVITSARSYHKVGVFRLQLIFALIFVLYFFGVDQQTLAHIKQTALRNN